MYVYSVLTCSAHNHTMSCMHACSRSVTSTLSDAHSQLHILTYAFSRIYTHKLMHAQKQCNILHIASRESNLDCLKVVLTLFDNDSDSELILATDKVMYIP